MSAGTRRIPILDGWRALSILFVLAGHLLPLGPRAWEANGAVAATGMAVFFVLSGFLITTMLLDDTNIRNFLIRRIFRILPLAWVAMLVLIFATGADLSTAIKNLLFVSNLPPTALMTGGEHLWSLCVEVQFYLSIALLVAVFGRRGLYALPVLAVGITAIRIAQGATISIFTWQRVDEILAGGTLALCVHSGLLQRAAKLPKIAPLVLIALTMASGASWSGPLGYARPYLAAAAVGISIVSAPTMMRQLFTSRAAVYVATVSYALYVVHGMLSASWLGTGEKLVRYAKRPLLILATFGLAHASTFWFEARMIAVGKRLTKSPRNT